ncbi:MAG: thioesterase family protein [Paludibacteraceae bacterium]
MMLGKGLFFEQQKIVNTADTAVAMGSGALSVFATPAMVAFMENTATKVIENCLSATDTSVGTAIDVKHLKATSVGDTVFCRATLVEVAGRQLSFEIIVTDACQNVIGTAQHTRFVVDRERFLSKLK